MRNHSLPLYHYFRNNHSNTHHTTSRHHHQSYHHDHHNLHEIISLLPSATMTTTETNTTAGQKGPPRSQQAHERDCNRAYRSGSGSSCGEMVKIEQIENIRFQAYLNDLTSTSIYIFPTISPPLLPQLQHLMQLLLYLQWCPLPLWRPHVQRRLWWYVSRSHRRDIRP